jgi:hypothetical protein
VNGEEVSIRDKVSPFQFHLKTHEELIGLSRNSPAGDDTIHPQRERPLLPLGPANFSSESQKHHQTHGGKI